MTRNFGVRLEMFRDFWHASDNESDPVWPLALACAAILAIVLIAIFIT